VRGLEAWRPTAFGVVILCLLLVRPDGLLAFRIATTRTKAVAGSKPKQST